MVSDVRKRDWSWVGVVDNGGALIAPFIGLQCGERRMIKEREAAAMELQ
jgi:hypothetical protein